KGMALAIEETDRRRARQVAYNTEHGIDPTPLRKKIADVTDMLAREDIDTAELLAGGYRKAGKGGQAGAAGGARRSLAGVAASDLAGLIQELSDQMHAAAAELQFELAARLRDEISDLKKELRQLTEATA
ncbi:MAG: UvrB/UvrC motif-containing protein, partial [Actinomycetota bacterium]|nr:UvrB/UvrC motif-containing protein [Actinomycetota bacterium]